MSTKTFVDDVTQIFNLHPGGWLHAVARWEFSSHPCRLQVGVTADFKSALRNSVTQIFNLL
jgi:hypothetical protein